MRLFEAILDANHRALSGDPHAGLRPSEFPDALPVVALTCIDVRLNRLLPEVLGVHEDDFIWLRNAGNIIFDPLSSMMRTLALACAIKGGKEIAIIGHTDCRVRQVSVSQLLESFRALGILRADLPDNLVEFFGLFASERQNVINGVEHTRRSPLISPKVPVHGLMVDIETGRLEWLVNGYEHLGGTTSRPSPLLQKFEQLKDTITARTGFDLGAMKLPAEKIGELAADAQRWLADVQLLKDDIKEVVAHVGKPAPVPPVAPAPPPKVPTAIPIPPPIRPLRTPPKKKG